MFFNANNLYKKMSTVTVDLSLSAEEGTMTAIVGPSGSGKTTVLRMIAGLEKSDSKDESSPFSITIGGTDVTKLPVCRRQIGMVFQNGALFNHLSVEDNVAYGPVCHGVKRSEARRAAAELLDKMNLKGFGKRSVETLSGGEAQRVSLARTLAIKPKIVLFDEPLSAVDAPLRKKLGEEIRAIQKSEKFTGIFVTHDINEAKTISDSIVLIKNGKILWQGPSKDFDESLMKLF